MPITLRKRRDGLREELNPPCERASDRPALTHCAFWRAGSCRNSFPRSACGELERAVTAILDVMSEEFANKDELLQAQGIMVVYYLLFKGGIESGQLVRITRKRLLNFRQKLAENREAAVKHYPSASFDLLEFDRLNQQGTNDASSIKERYRILSTALRVPLLKFDGLAPGDK